MPHFARIHFEGADVGWLVDNLHGLAWLVSQQEGVLQENRPCNWESNLHDEAFAGVSTPCLVWPDILAMTGLPF